MLAPIVQMVWILRFLLASYVALCLVLLMPENLFFNDYASSISFSILLVILTLVERGRFFDVSSSMAGRFSLPVFGLGFLTIFFLVAIFCNFLPFEFLESFFSKEVYDLFIQHIFYLSVAPLLFSILFAKKL